VKNAWMGGSMTTGAPALPNLQAALYRANKMIFEKEYIVVAANEKAGPKEPVFLQLKYSDGKTRNIGITHLVHLRGSDWDNKPLSEIAKTTAEVAKAIVDRITLFFDAEAHKMFIDENGTIFAYSHIPFKLHQDHTFSVNGVMVTYQGIPLALTKIKSEGIILFRPLENGHVELFDTIDKRKGKGIFIHTDGSIYRA
jgi:hypothetical protein